MSEIQNKSNKNSETSTQRVSRKEKTKSPFHPAETRDKRLKLFLWGDSGAGKTTLALQFPKPAVIDLERGTDLYGDAFKFKVLKTTDADDVMGTVDWLLTHPHNDLTLVIDPITIYWDALQRKWSEIFLRRNKGSKGYRFEFYDLQVRDWMTIKAEFKEFVRKLIALDMHVICTARQKTQYGDSGFMKAVGVTFDGEKSLPYLFDTIVRVFRDGQGRFMGECLKDRSNKLPTGEFEVSYDLFERLFGKENLVREARPLSYATGEQKSQIRDFIEQFGITPDQVAQRLAAYGTDDLDNLTEENALRIINKFKSAQSTRDESTTSGKEA